MSTFEVTRDSVEIDRFRAIMFAQEPPPPAGAAARILDQTAGANLDFTAIIPAPLADGADDSEEWALSRWGTFWNVRNSRIRKHDAGGLLFSFDIPWDFPTPVFEALAVEFRKLAFTGSAHEEHHEFEYEGQFNGDRSWRLV
jgi:hypothetical protein